MPDEPSNVDDMSLIKIPLTILLLLMCGRSEIALAARIYTNTQVPANGTAFAMGSTQSITYTVANTSTGTNSGERIYEVRFRINSGSLFNASTAAPAGWTRTSFSTTQVIFQATSWAAAIPVGSPLGFTLSIAMRTASVDATNERLRDMRARFTTTTTGPPFTRLQSVTTSTPGLWTLKSLLVTSFQITDLSGVPVSAIQAGASFQLRMSATNVSNTSRSITSNPNPPTPTKVGTVTQVLTGTSGSPLVLAAGASGTVIFTYSTASTDAGTIFFTASVQSGGTVTSTTATSGALSVASFAASIGVAPVCQYAGSNVTVTMTVINGSVLFPVTGVSPTLLLLAGAPVALVSGPTPATIASIATSSNGSFAWIYQLNSTGATNPFTFSGSASGTRNAGAVVTPTSISTPTTRRGLFVATVNPGTTNAGSNGLELTFNVTNSGCANVGGVAITFPAGWTSSGDTYSLVNIAAGTSIETWTVSGVNPVTFTAPNVAGQMPVTYSGDFNIVFSGMPAAATTSGFTVRVTDVTGAFVDLPVSVLVGAFKSGNLNDALTKSWREDFR